MIKDLIKNILNVKNIGCHGYFQSLITIPIEKIIKALTVSGVIVRSLFVLLVSI